MTRNGGGVNVDEGLKVGNMSPENSPMSHRQHTLSTIALCMCSLVNAYLQISVFPYAGFMVIHLNSSITQDNVGTRAGAIASSFMVGRSLSAYGWGKVADVYGRTFVLQSCLLLSSLVSILFGTSRSFGQAMLWRFCLGMSNGIISTAKTTATELAYGDRTLERRAMGLVMGMRSWGFLISPALGGLLAEPVRQYPNARWLQQDGWIHYLLAGNPYLAPNLLAAAACMLAAFLLRFTLHETLPKDKLRHFGYIPQDATRYMLGPIKSATYFLFSCVRPRPDDTESDRFLVSTSSSAADGDAIELVSPDQANGVPSRDAPTAWSIWSRQSTRRFMIAHWSFAFVTMMIDEAFPLFCMSKTGGLALTEVSIGKVLSGAGILFAICQYAVFSTLVYRFGESMSMMIGSVLGVQPSALIPLSLLLNRGTESGVSWGILSLLSFSMGACKLFGSLYFTSLALSLNKTVPDAQRATMNGVVVVGASVARAVAPAFAGYIATLAFSSNSIPPRFGSLLLYSVISLLGGLVCIRTWKLRVATATVGVHQYEMVSVRVASSEAQKETDCNDSESRPIEKTRHEHIV